MSQKYQDKKSRRCFVGNKGLKEGLKHGDFIILDMICLQLCFTISYWMHISFSNPYRTDDYQYQAVILTTCQLLVIVFSNNYRGILRRGRLEEIFSIVKYISCIIVISLVYLFAVKHSITASRLQFGLTSVTFLEGVSSIKINFKGCTGIKTVNLPKSVKEINKSFVDSKNITTVNYAGSEADWKKIVFVNNVNPFENLTINYQKELHTITVKKNIDNGSNRR